VKVAGDAPGLCLQFRSSVQQKSADPTISRHCKNAHLLKT
jgi:hypothetical protein